MTPRELELIALAARATMGLLNTFNKTNLLMRCQAHGLTEDEAEQVWDALKPIVWKHADDLIDAQETETSDYRAVAIYDDSANWS